MLFVHWVEPDSKYPTDSPCLGHNPIHKPDNQYWWELVPQNTVIEHEMSVGRMISLTQIQSVFTRGQTIIVGYIGRTSAHS